MCKAISICTLCICILPYSFHNFLKLAEVFSKDGMSFLASCQNLVPRPWVIDDLDTFKLKWSKNPWKKASLTCIKRYNFIIDNWIFCLLAYFMPWYCSNLCLLSWQVIIFVDNSGADIILGIMPFARELLRRGSQVCWIFYLFIKEKIIKMKINIAKEMDEKEPFFSILIKHIKQRNKRKSL